MKEKFNALKKKKTSTLALFGNQNDSLLNPQTFKKDFQKENTKIDHTYLFGKWKDFNIDTKKLREESW